MKAIVFEVPLFCVEEPEVIDAEQASDAVILEGINEIVFAVRFSPTGVFVAVGDDAGGVALYSSAHEFKLWFRIQEGAGIRTIGWETDDRFACAGASMKMSVWTVGAPVADVQEERSDWCTGVAFIPGAELRTILLSFAEEDLLSVQHWEARQIADAADGSAHI